MTASPVYQASPIRRTRATKAEVEARREALLDIIEAGRPDGSRAGREGGERLRQGPNGPHHHALGGGAALRLARRQHPLATQAADLQQGRAGAQRTAYVEIRVEKDALPFTHRRLPIYGARCADSHREAPCFQ